MTAFAIAALLWAWLLGGLIVLALWPRERAMAADRWLIAPLGLLVGMAATSITYFFASLVFASAARAAFVAELGLAGVLVFRVRGRCWGRSEQPGPLDNPILWLMASLVAQVALGAGGLAVRAYYAEPYGGWDAWAIWNLHAREMVRAGPEWTQLLAAPQLSWTHPDYPRLVPASVARVWAWAGAEAPGAAGMVSAVFALATMALLIEAVARVRGRWPALLGGALLAGTPFFATFSTNQHADIPLAAFMLATVVLGTLEPRGFRVLAALCAAWAAWTKNEGLLFALIFSGVWCVAAWRKGERRALIGFVAALALGLLPLAYFKVFLAPPNDLLAAPLGGRLAQLWDGGRHAMIAASLWRDLVAFGEWRIAPYFAMALPFLAWRSRRRLDGGEWTILVVLGLMLAGYYVVYLLTPLDLAWHIDSSLVRLLLQLWPLALLAWGLAVPCPVFPLAEHKLEARSNGARRSPSTWIAFVVVNAVIAAAVLFAFSRQPAANELVFARGIAAVPDEGWFGIERLDRTTWVWSGGDATLQLHVSGSQPRDVSLRFSLRSLAPRHVEVRSGDRVLWRGNVSDQEFVRVELPRLTLPPGATALRFSTDAPGVPESIHADARALAFALYDVALR